MASVARMVMADNARRFGVGKPKHLRFIGPVEDWEDRSRDRGFVWGGFGDGKGMTLCVFNTHYVRLCVCVCVYVVYDMYRWTGRQ
jgi:hypothetical protein